MALSSLRLRRALALPASFLKHRPFSAAAVALPPSPPLTPSTTPSKPGFPAPTRLGGAGLRPHYAIQRLSFRSSAPLSDRRWGDGEDSKIDPDEILFEGCDYNHWLITMDFPKDPKPTPEEMVETYVQTLAKVVGSVEEAKKRMYACSTTTYTGFQAVMTEEMSEKFRGLPGVVFILPDSYIDPINKEYGGDKYDNGVITPRPPPVQYGRQGRYGDRNRNFDRPRYDRQPMQQRNQSVYQQGPPQGEGRNDAPQQNYDRYDRQPMQQRNPSFYQQGPPQGEGRNDAPQQNYGQDRYDRQPMQQKNPSFYHQGPPQGEGRSDAPQQNYGQDRNFSQGQQGSGYRHGTSSGYGGAYQQHGSAYGQNFTGASGQNYGQSNSGLREGQPPPHVDDQGRMTQREQSNFTYPPPTGENQGRY